MTCLTPRNLLSVRSTTELPINSTPHSDLSGFDDLVSNCVPHELAYGMDVQLPHDVGAMSFGGLDADAQERRDLLAAPALRKQLHDFTLAGRQSFADRFVHARTRSRVVEPCQHHLRSFVCQERLVVRQFFQRIYEVAIGIRLHYVSAHSSLNNFSN